MFSNQFYLGMHDLLVDSRRKDFKEIFAFYCVVQVKSISMFVMKYFDIMNTSDVMFFLYWYLIGGSIEWSKRTDEGRKRNTNCFFNGFSIFIYTYHVLPFNGKNPWLLKNFFRIFTNSAFFLSGFSFANIHDMAAAQARGETSAYV